MKRIKPIFFCAATSLVTSCGRDPSPHIISPSPPPKTIQAPAALGAGERWSKEVVHFPGFPVGGELREWSHHEIAQRHKTLVMKDLPEYITELRGAAPQKETKGSVAAWYFRVPQDRLPDFERYLLDLGIPQEYLHENKGYTALPPGTPKRGTPSDRIIYGQTSVSVGEDTLMGMKFGKSVESVTYGLYNPNITRAVIRIIVAWKTGDVQILENPVNPDWE